MQAATDAQTREMSVDGILYRQHAQGTVKFHSLCGGLRLRRFSYRAVGERNGRTCIPLDLQLGIVEGATPAFASLRCSKVTRKERFGRRAGPACYAPVATLSLDDGAAGAAIGR